MAHFLKDADTDLPDKFIGHIGQISDVAGCDGLRCQLTDRGELVLGEIEMQDLGQCLGDPDGIFLYTDRTEPERAAADRRRLKSTVTPAVHEARRRSLESQGDLHLGAANVGYFAGWMRTHLRAQITPPPIHRRVDDTRLREFENAMIV